MAIGRIRRDSGMNYWPGFVDALSTLVLGVIFLLTIFVVVQFFLSQEVSGKDTALAQLNAVIAKLNDDLSLEKSSKVSLEDEIIEAFGEKPAARIRKRLAGRGELTSIRMRRLFVRAQAKKERQHFKDRKLLMHYEKQRAEMRKNMGLNPVLG